MKTMTNGAQVEADPVSCLGDGRTRESPACRRVESVANLGLSLAQDRLAPKPTCSCRKRRESREANPAPRRRWRCRRSRKLKRQVRELRGVLCKTMRIRFSTQCRIHRCYKVDTCNRLRCDRSMSREGSSKDAPRYAIQIYASDSARSARDGRPIARPATRSFSRDKS